MGASWEKYTGCRQAMTLFSIVKPCEFDCTSWYSYIALQSDVFFCNPIAKVANKNIVSIWIAINQHSGVFCVEIHIILIIKMYPPRAPLVGSKIANSSQVFRAILKTSVSACLSFPPPTYPFPSSLQSMTSVPLPACIGRYHCLITSEVLHVYNPKGSLVSLVTTTILPSSSTM